MVRTRRKKATLESISLAFTNWVGTTNSILVHTFFFIGIFTLSFFGVATEQILLILTTAVSLEAIYLAIFIQMTVNRNTASLLAVEDSIEDIQEDVEEIQEDVEDLEEEVEDISEDIDDISKDVDGISEDIIEIQSDDNDEDLTDEQQAKKLDLITDQLQILLKEIDQLKQK